MQSFKNYLKEYAGVGPSSVPMSVDDTEMNMASLSNPKVIRALNSYVGAIANMEYMLPEHALRIMKEKLSRIGLSFGSIPEMTEESGSVDLPLTLFGGRFGKDENTPHDEFINDDGLSDKIEGGLTLKLQYEMLKNNSCRVFAKVE